jgi:hypothetical protein
MQIRKCNRFLGDRNHTAGGMIAISPLTGTYSSPQTVTITDATSGATIYYTTNAATLHATSSDQFGTIFTKLSYWLSGWHWGDPVRHQSRRQCHFSINVVTRGTYSVKCSYKGSTSRGISQLSVNGTNLG